MDSIASKIATSTKQNFSTCSFWWCQKRGLAVPQVVCLERHLTPSGFWNLTYKKGVDQYGDPVHRSMYQFLWSGAPKESIETKKYTFDEHHKQHLASYPPRFMILNYLLER